mgnify:CR=1 FL=1
MKKNLLLIVFVLFGCSSNNVSSSEISSSTTNENSSVVQEGELYIKNVNHYITYAPTKIETYMDKVLVDNLDLYYDIIDSEICEIKDNYVYGLKVGETTVYAQTIMGQEVSFTVRVKDYTEYIYDITLNVESTRVY